jgi:response regulator RpfG family c-di-GMP phosphodiesterase
VLIIDDRPQIRGWLDRLLENEGFDVFFATSGNSGFLQAKAGQPDLILINPMMRICKSAEVFARIKTDWSTSHIKLAFLPDLSCFAEVNFYQEEDFEISLSGAPLPVGELFGQIYSAMHVHGSIYV